ncbi:MAG: regulatory protein MarR [Bacteroidetes bacterium]|nr:MAG: regulatory protein MarR [Bacteroidota bacterium]
MKKLEQVYFYHLEKAIKTYRQFAQQQIRKKGYTITVDQWLLLKAIEENPGINQNALSEMVFKDKASVARIIELLVSEGYLARSTQASGGSRSRITLTAPGKKIIRKILPVIMQNRETALNKIPRTDISVSEKVLKSIIKNCTDGKNSG